LKTLSSKLPDPAFGNLLDELKITIYH